MGYSKETYAKAHSIMQDRRMNALREADLRNNFIKNIRVRSKLNGSFPKQQQKQGRLF